MSWANVVVEGMRRMAREAKHALAKPGPRVWRRWLKIGWLVLIAIVFAFLAYTIWRDRNALLAVLRAADYKFFVWAIVFYLGGTAAAATGWHFIMCHVGKECGFVLNFKIYVYTLAARRLPGTLWYIASRSVLYKRMGLSGLVPGLASGVEVVLSIATGFIVGAPALFVVIGLSIWTILLFVGIEIAGLIVLSPRILIGILGRFKHYVSQDDVTFGRILLWFLSYVIMWISGGFMLYMFIMAIYPASGGHMPLIVSMWALAGSISFLTFILPSSFGLAELTLTFLLSTLMPISIAVTIALFIRLSTTFVDIMCSSLYILDRTEVKGGI